MQQTANSKTHRTAATCFASSAAALHPRQGTPLPTPSFFALGIAVGVLLSLGTPAHATDAELIGRGGAIAANHCSKCHAVGQTDASPQKITPPLRALAERFPVDMLREAQKTGQIAGHDEMPGFELGVDGVAALLAYIDSLSPAGPHYLPGAK